MIEIQSKKLFFKRRSFWFAEHPHDVDKCDSAFFYAVSGQHDVSGFKCTESPTFLIDLTQDRDEIFKNMSKECRRKINHSIRDGITIKKNQDQQAFYDLYSDFVKSKGGFGGDLDLYWDFIESGSLYTCYYEDNLIGGLLTIYDNNHARWLLSGSKRLASDDKKLARITGNSNNLIIWEAIQDAQEKGLKWFDLGGYYDGDDQENPQYRIAQYKKSFGGIPVKQYKYSKYYSLPLRMIKGLKQRV